MIHWPRTLTQPRIGFDGLCDEAFGLQNSSAEFKATGQQTGDGGRVRTAGAVGVLGIHTVGGELGEGTLVKQDIS